MTKSRSIKINKFVREKEFYELMKLMFGYASNQMYRYKVIYKYRVIITLTTINFDIFLLIKLIVI